jgi:hypothetical protein
MVPQKSKYVVTLHDCERYRVSLPVGEDLNARIAFPPIRRISASEASTAEGT